MKKLFWFVAFGLAGVYGSGYASLGESGANRFLNQMEEFSAGGNAQALCDLLHDELEVSLDDRSGGQTVKFSGGKEEFCAYTKKAVPALALMVSSTNVTREDFSVKREWPHPWTADAAYTERRSMSMERVGMQINTVSEDKLMLVKTLRGVRIKRLESTVWNDQTSDS